VTVIVGRKIEGDITTIHTTNPDADQPRTTTIEMPNANALVRTIAHTGPKWSLYVKGMYVKVCSHIERKHLKASTIHYQVE